MKTHCGLLTRRPRRTFILAANIIEASWRALVDAVEYKLWKDDEVWARQGQFESNHVKRTPCEAGEMEASEEIHAEAA